jgi:toxin FitB
MFLLDTCVVSEGTRPRPNEAVARWMAAQDTPKLFISAITAGELRYGVDRMPPGRESNRLHSWLEETLQKCFPGRILAFDHVIAALWGNLRAGYPNAEIADSQIAATALAHGLTLVTRNVKDFRFDGLSVINPWKEG